MCALGRSRCTVGSNPSVLAWLGDANGVCRVVVAKRCSPDGEPLRNAVLLSTKTIRRRMKGCMVVVGVGWFWFLIGVNRGKSRSLRLRPTTLVVVVDLFVESKRTGCLSLDLLFEFAATAFHLHSSRRWTGLLRHCRHSSRRKREGFVIQNTKSNLNLII